MNSSSLAQDAEPAVPQGRPGDVEMRPAPPGGVPYFLYRPSELDPDARAIVVVHGISRNADQHVDAFAPFAKRANRLVIAPIFSRESCRRYQQVVTQRCRADLLLLAVLRDVAALTGRAVDGVDLFGFSGGAQFAHRFAMLYPDRVASLALSSAGWYTFPGQQDRYPYGIASSTRTGRKIAANLDRYLRIPTLVLVGEHDVQRDGALRKNPTIDRQQGRTRVDRAGRWVEAARDVADARGVEATTTLRLMADCGHDFTDCVSHGGLAWHVMDWFSAHASDDRERRTQSALSAAD